MLEMTHIMKFSRSISQNFKYWLVILTRLYLLSENIRGRSTFLIKAIEWATNKKTERWHTRMSAKGF